MAEADALVLLLAVVVVLITVTVIIVLSKLEKDIRVLFRQDLNDMSHLNDALVIMLDIDSRLRFLESELFIYRENDDDEIIN